MKRIMLINLFFLFVALPAFSQPKDKGAVQTTTETKGSPNNELILLSPGDGHSFDGSSTLKPLVFRAKAGVPIRPGTKYNFRIKVWQLMEGQSAAQATRTNLPIVVKDVDNLDQLTIAGIFTGPCKPPYLCDFVWTAEISINDGKTILSSNYATFSVQYKKENAPAEPVVKAIDQQVWEYLGPRVVCEKLGVSFQAAKRTGLNAYMLSVEFTEVKYYASAEFVNHLPSPLPSPIISVTPINIPPGINPPPYCDKLGRQLTPSGGIYEIRENNSRTNGGNIDLGSVPPVNFEFFTFANIWNNEKNDNLDNECSECEQEETPEWWGNEPPEPEIEINTEHEWNPEENHKPVLVFNNGKPVKLIISDKKQANELKASGLLLSEKAEPGYIKCSCAKNGWVKDADAQKRICDYLKGLMKKGNFTRK